MTDLFVLSTSFWCSVNILGFVSGGINTKSTDFSSSRSVSLVVLGDGNSSFNCRKIKNPKSRLGTREELKIWNFWRTWPVSVRDLPTPDVSQTHRVRTEAPPCHPPQSSAQNPDRNMNSASAGQPQLERKTPQHPQNADWTLNLLGWTEGTLWDQFTLAGVACVLLELSLPSLLASLVCARIESRFCPTFTSIPLIFASSWEFSICSDKTTLSALWQGTHKPTTG